MLHVICFFIFLNIYKPTIPELMKRIYSLCFLFSLLSCLDVAAETEELSTIESVSPGIGGNSGKQIIVTGPSLSEEEIQKKVLEQLGFTEENIYNDFYKYRTLPWDETQAAIILPVISSFEDHNNHVLDAYVLVINKADGKILHQHYEPAGWISDANGDSERAIFNITFDFAPYRVCPERRAFGVRTEYMSTNMDPWNSQLLSLFLPGEEAGMPLYKILSDFEVFSDKGEWDEGKAGEAGTFREAKTILIISDNINNHGYADIIAKTKVKEYVRSGTSHGEAVIASEKDITATAGGTRILKFNGAFYFDPEAEGL